MTELDIEQPHLLLGYLRDSRRLGPHEHVGIERLAGGVSNRTVLVTREGGDDWVIKQALPKLRVEVDWYSDTRRIHREASGLRCLEKLLPPGTVPPMLFEDFDQRLLAMRAVPQPHENWKEMLLAGRLEPAHVEQFAKLLGQLHRRSCERGAELSREFGDRSNFKTLRLEPYYGYSAERLPQLSTFFEELMTETLETRLCLVHGDYSPKNILVHDDTLVLLDHEVIHFGDPGFDVGFALTHLLSKANHLEMRRRDFAAAAHQFWRRYFSIVDGSNWATMLEQRACRHLLGCLLARVTGRSQLEYLGDQERTRQRDSATALLRRGAVTMSATIDGFLGGL